MCHTGSRPRRELGGWLGLDEPAGKVTAEVTVPALVLSEFKDTDSVSSLGAIGAKAKACPADPMLKLFGSNWTNETWKGTEAPPMDAVNEELPKIDVSSTPDGVTITVPLSEP